MNETRNEADHLRVPATGLAKRPGPPLLGRFCTRMASFGTGPGNTAGPVPEALAILGL